MIPNLKERELDTQGVTASTVFGISVNDTAHIMSILRDTLYTDKVMAVLREYSANAWDAHRESGKSDVPIKVTIPTDMDPTLRIQDFGTGLSHQDVFEIYTQYGASTKRGSDNSVGMLGIGSKSGFAYSDSFTVISCHGGKRRTYVAVLDSSEKGVINLFDEQDCGDETGITIEIAVRKNDIPEFINKAKYLYKYFSPRPDINVDLPDITGTQFDLKNGRISEYSDETQWTAVMGCVPYRINTDQLYENGNRMVGAYVDEIKGLLYFDIGEVQVNASREELKYSDSTKKAIAEKFAALMDEYVESTIKNIEAGSFTMWQKRMRAKMLDQLELPLPENLKDLCKEWVELQEHKTFNLYRQDGTNPLIRLPVEHDLRILIRTEDAKSLRGYQYSSNDFTVRVTDGHTIDEMKQELQDCLEKANLSGVPVLPITYLRWEQPWDERREEERKRKEAEKKAARAAYAKLKGSNKKYFSRVFTLKMDADFKHPYSQMWEVISEYEPKEDDVYVIIENFRTVDESHMLFTARVRGDESLCKLFGLKMPVIYGYKSTEKFRVEASDVTGISYKKWREKFFKEALTQPKVIATIRDLELVDSWPQNYYAEGKTRPEKMVHSVNRSWETLCLNLGKRHPITKWAKQVHEATTRYKWIPERERIVLDEFVRDTRPKNYQSPPEVTKALFLKLYPVLAFTNNGIAVLWDGSSRKSPYNEYVKDMDQLRRLRNKSRRS